MTQRSAFSAEETEAVIHWNFITAFPEIRTASIPMKMDWWFFYAETDAIGMESYPHTKVQ